ncbi:hypothetical protein LTR59_014734 [Friedmanniomyces endolithicus]|nr:hypothetical protein LTR59_014734 [Friedmanniomyces endolithicus]KAK0778991.1 hypothetical protein LTR38_014603 [Friedmanniomyces endolithicus]KAK0782776.1 hypothetical protein LTR75_014315 [Friedmanniomyces endolithicus]
MAGMTYDSTTKPDNREEREEQERAGAESEPPRAERVQAAVATPFPDAGAPVSDAEVPSGRQQLLTDELQDFGASEALANRAAQAQIE